MSAFQKALPFALASLTLASLALLAPACDPEHIDKSAPVAANNLVTPASLGITGEWTEEAPGLWMQEDSEGNQQFLGIGAPGQNHAIASLEAAKTELVDALNAHESEGTHAQLEQLDSLITDLHFSEMPPTGLPDLRCTPTVNATADAAPSSCGVTAKSNAFFSHCSNTGTVRTYAQAICGYESKNHTCGPKPGTSTSCASQVSITGPAPCRSYTYAQISAPNVSLYVWDENFQRGTCTSPPPPLQGECNPDTCGPGKGCQCGDICRPVNQLCP